MPIGECEPPIRGRKGWLWELKPTAKDEVLPAIRNGLSVGGKNSAGGRRSCAASARAGRQAPALRG
jgi:hypothetical protein